MTTDRRTVAHLRLDAPDRDVLRRGEGLLRDAFRTASLPGDGGPGRLFVRSLALGRIDLRGSPRRVALGVERQLRAAIADAVAIDDPAAADAPAVRVRDDAEALVELLRRCAAGAPLDAWFWPLVAPALRSSRAPAAVIGAALRGLAQGRAGTAAVAAGLDLVVADGRAADVLAVLTAPDGAALAQAAGVAAGRHDAAALIAGEPVGLTPAWRAVLRRRIPAWGPRADRSRWLAAMALVAVAPARAASPALAAAARWLAERVAAEVAAAVPASSEERTDGRRSPPVAAVELAGTAPPARPAARGGDPVPGTAAAAVAPAAGSAAQARTAVARRGRARWEASERPQPTEHAGLFFVCAVLERLGIAAFLADHPALADAGLGARVLTRIADQLGAPVDDPVRAPLIDRGAALAPVAFAIPPAWREVFPGLAEALAEAAIDGDELERAARAWTAAVGRWLARYTEVAIDDVVRRPGALVCTRTHVDVVLDVQHADVRLRRPGLDLDPGWLPWLGRVVTYHYVHGGILAG
jgi:hypothetical protein